MNFEYARENMIKQQILSEGIPLGKLIDAMASTSREKFLPKNLESLAYSDSRLMLGGREIKSPMIMAKLLYALDLKDSDKALKLGLESGYTLAIMAKVVKSVDVLDYSEEKLSEVKRKLASMDVHNVETNAIDHLDSMLENQETYDCIYVSNVVKDSDIEDSLLKLLEVGGRMVFVVETEFFNKTYMITRTSQNDYEKKFLFDIYSK